MWCLDVEIGDNKIIGLHKIASSDEPRFARIQLRAMENLEVVPMS